MRIRLGKSFAGLVAAWLLASASTVLAESSIPAEPIAHDADYQVAGTPKDRPWAFTLYTVWLSEEQLGDVLLFQGELEDSQLWVVGLSRRVASLTKNLDFEIEAQLGKHAGPVQRHWETNLLGLLRWSRFPWSNHIGTTLATGLGVSYAFEEPEFEIQAHEKTNRLLAYIMVELTLFIPAIPQWQLVTRIHHRSSAYGTFESDIQGASNSFGLGVKYRF